MLKHSSFKLKDAILKLFNLVLKSGHFPEIWKENLITPILNKVRSTAQTTIEASHSAVTWENYSALLLMTD